MAKVKSKKEHYVDNKKLFEEMKKFKELCKDASECGDERPAVPHYIGECFLKIANGLSFRPNFVNYTYKEEMVSDGIENCLQYLYNFDPSKSNNPFCGISGNFFRFLSESISFISSAKFFKTSCL